MFDLLQRKGSLLLINGDYYLNFKYFIMIDCVGKTINKHDIVVFSEYRGGRLQLGIAVETTTGSVTITQVRTFYQALDNTNVFQYWSKTRKTSSSLVFVVSDPASVLSQKVSIGPHNNPTRITDVGEVVQYIIANYA